MGKLLDNCPQLQGVKTATSRPRRADETLDAKTWMRQRPPEESYSDYVTALQDEYDLVECTPHNNHVYGLPRQSLTGVPEGSIPLIDTDVSGIRKLQLALRQEFSLISFLVCPESAEQLETRMRSLGTDVNERLDAAQWYLEEAPNTVNFVLRNQADSDVESAISRSSDQLLQMLGTLSVINA